MQTLKPQKANGHASTSTSITICGSQGEDGYLSSAALACRSLFFGVLAVGVVLSALVFAPVALAQNDKGVLRGVVFQGKRERPLQGASITVLGTAIKQSTDKDGAFYIKLPPGKYKLQIQVAGFGKVVTKSIPVVSDETTEAVISLRKGADQKTIVDVEAAIRKKPRYKRKQYKGPLVEVRGSVTDKKKKKPIGGARIYVRGFSMEIISKVDGTFVLKLPPGKHDMTVIHPKFSTASKRDVVIKQGEKPRLKIEMAPALLELKTYTVTAPKIEGSTVELMRQRKESSSVAEVLGAQEIARTGDSNAASALKRVSGVTLVGGKYVYVRGLGERYSSALLNGSSLPSPEPERRVVPLDLFPAGVLEKVVIEKTFLPYMPGEFAGGSVQLYTRGFPSRFKASIGLSIGAQIGIHTDGTTFGNFSNGISYSGGPLDFFGFDAGHRALPSNIYSASKESPLSEKGFTGKGYDAATLEKFGEQLRNKWGADPRLLPPNFGINFSIGDSFSLLGGRAGYYFSTTFSNGWNAVRPKLSIYTLGGEGLEKSSEYEFQTVSNDIRLGAMLVLGVNFGKNHKLRLTSLLARITDNETRIYEGYNRDVDTDIRATRLRWVEQMLFTQQVRSVNQFSVLAGLSLESRYTYSLATRGEPDRRETRYDLEPSKSVFFLSDRPEGNQRFFSDLLDNNHDVGLDATLKFKQWTKETAKVRIGGVGVFKDRRVDTRRYKYLHRGPASNNFDILTRPAEEIFVPENIGPNGFLLGEITRKTDNYSAEQQIGAGYAMIDLPLGLGFRLIGGARLEYSRQFVSTFELFSNNPETVSANLENLDILPSAGIAFSFWKGMVLRAAFARTVSRPDFRELSPATFNDVTGGRQIRGNPSLVRALVYHADFRWEWYLGRGESVSIGAFYKRFENPIENIVIASANLSQTFANALGAQNFGVEIDFRKKFGFLHPVLRDLFVSGNISLITSQIEIDPNAGGVQTSNERPLQGQSPYVINLQVGYDNVDIGTRLTLLYNVFGPRISSVGANGAPDVYEQPFHQLDLVFRQKIWKGLNLSFKAKNILDLPQTFIQGQYVTKFYTRGREFSLGLSYNFK